MSIALTQGAGLAAGAEAKFAVTATCGGSPYAMFNARTSVSDGELCVEVLPSGFMIIVE